MYGTPGAISGSVTREGLRAALERKASLLLGGFGSPAATGDHSAGGVGRRIRAALFTASFESSRQPQNAFEVAVGLRPSFSGKLVRVNYNFYQGFKVDCDRFLIELRCVYPGQGVLRLTPGVANLLEECAVRQSARRTRAACSPLHNTPAGARGRSRMLCRGRMTAQRRSKTPSGS
jgi:hypothetical protein